MKLIKTKIPDLLILKSQIFKDKRGFLKETFRDNILKKNFPFDVMSYSKKTYYVVYIFKVNFHKVN